MLRDVNMREAQIYIKKHKETENIPVSRRGVVSQLGVFTPERKGGCKNITALS